MKGAGLFRAYISSRKARQKSALRFSGFASDHTTTLLLEHFITHFSTCQAKINIFVNIFLFIFGYIFGFFVVFSVNVIEWKKFAIYFRIRSRRIAKSAERTLPKPQASDLCRATELLRFFV